MDKLLNSRIHNGRNARVFTVLVAGNEVRSSLLSSGARKVKIKIKEKERTHQLTYFLKIVQFVVFTDVDALIIRCCQRQLFYACHGFVNLIDLAVFALDVLCGSQIWVFICSFLFLFFFFFPLFLFSCICKI